ncbi:hypothetical protein STASHLEY_01000 [Brevundimonas phage vB_BpoS-StAshley]|nr:hypothetical protein STASHLEY_01000 [Brevundimonas phage vB_BpoS-StAshley]UTC30137.1 hypothetical protein MAINES_01000 [Brevundimonas phage vB_BpoS-MaInes]
MIELAVQEVQESSSAWIREIRQDDSTYVTIIPDVVVTGVLADTRPPMHCLQVVEGYQGSNHVLQGMLGGELFRACDARFNERLDHQDYQTLDKETKIETWNLVSIRFNWGFNNP